VKVYLVNPLFEPDIWSFEGAHGFTGTRTFSTPLGLATVAALTPKHWDVEIGDQNVAPLNFDTDADLIGITSFNVQYKHALAIAKEFRRRGKPVVFGGPYCTLTPDAFAGHGDFRVCGEAELIWPEFLSDFERGSARELYMAEGKASLEQSPVPRYDLISGDNYMQFFIQASRGCPFQCEFCDIIITDGRVPRTKTVEQVIAEVDHCVRQGALFVTFGDANFIANTTYAKNLLTALAGYSKAHDYPVQFSCELTINVAQRPDLLELMHAANFYNVFIGIESPRRESLLETKKNQNTRRDMVEDVKRIHSHHLTVVAGMIVGFDSDDRNIFKEQYEFLKELAIPFATCGTLLALPNTPLMKRLEAEGRLLDYEKTDQRGHGTADCNFVPKQMTLEELRLGHGWLMRSLYRYDSFGERLVGVLSRFQNPDKEHKRATFSPKLMVRLARIMRYYLLTTDYQRMAFFSRAAMGAAAGGPFSIAKWLNFFLWMASYRSLRGFVLRTQGTPEEADPTRPPFARLVSAPLERSAQAAKR
jgi:radical SAM superfamily enzyme YgiQ (UPF0313 family)